MRQQCIKHRSLTNREIADAEQQQTDAVRADCSVKITHIM